MNANKDRGGDTFRFAGREDEQTEFKQEWSSSIPKIIAGFANANGGCLYIGIKDDGVVVGVPEKELDEVNRQIVSAVKDKSNYSVHPEYVEIDGQTCIKISVPKSTDYLVSCSGRYFHRVGAQTIDMSNIEVTNWASVNQCVLEFAKPETLEKAHLILRASLNAYEIFGMQFINANEGRYIFFVKNEILRQRELLCECSAQEGSTILMRLNECGLIEVAQTTENNNKIFYYRLTRNGLRYAKSLERNLSY